MPDFSKITGSSAAAGFQYYDVQSFNQAIPGQTLAAFAGVLQRYVGTISMPKNRLSLSLTSQILTNVLVNFSNDQSAGQYFNLTGHYQKNFTIGTSGGFPIFYSMQADVNFDASNVNIIIDISNPSAVNAVTVPTITVSGKAFFYLAPF